MLDLFAGAGGAARGYQQAGFDVVGVDIEPQPHYPFEFHQADAMEYPLDGFDAVHASPPCQRYIRSGLTAKDGRHPDLLPPIRERLQASGLPWVIENVPGAPMRPDVVLCGSMFGLEVRRHRWFESNVDLFALLPPCCHDRPVAGVYGNPHGAGGAAPGMLPGDLATWSRAMDIPPAYTEWVGHQLIDAIRAVYS
jgi:hypothetical protein